MIVDGYPGGSLVKGKSPTLAFKHSPVIGVIHSTETDVFPNYPRGFEPHATVHPKARRWQQHVELSTAAYALKAPAGVSTNTWGAIQVEVVGRAASLKDLAGEDLTYLVGFLDFFFGAAGIVRQTSVTFRGSEAYGTGAAQRLSVDQWYAYRGWLGHQHVPGNSHWDPGAIPLSDWMGAPVVTPVSDPVVATPPAGPVVIAPGVPAPAFPLPAGAYFGPKAGPKASVSGYYSHREDLRRWQQRMKNRGWTISVDGLYGPQTAAVARAFQAEKGLTVDELIGPQTWAAAWTEPVTR